jgi:alcohol dehydrogenase
MEYSLAGALDRYARLAEALDHPHPVEGTPRRRAERAVEAVRELIADIGLPTRLRDAGVNESLIPALAKNAMVDLNWMTNPRAIDEAAMAALYRQAY